MKVRVAIAVNDESGDWHCYGDSHCDDAQTREEARDFLGSHADRVLIAEIEIPDPPAVIQAEAG